MKLKNIIGSIMLGSLTLASAQAQVKVGVVSSATGPVAMVGIPQKNTVALLPKKVGGYTIEYIALDDGSDPTAAVVAIKKLISENVDAIIGPSGSSSAMGVIQFVADAGVPLLAPVGTASVVLPMNAQKKWVFKTTQNDELIASALLDHMAGAGVKTVGFIGTSDPFGENWAKVFKVGAEKKGITVVADERFARQDTSVSGQALKILASRPDAVLIAAPGTPAVLPQITLAERGYKGQFYQTHGAALPDFLKLGGKKVEGTILASSVMLVVDEVSDSHPSKKLTKDYISRYEKAYGSVPATFGGQLYDAALLLEKAIPVAAKKGKPGTPEFRTALRDTLEKTHEFAGTQGVYNMSPEDHSGFDARGVELIKVKNGGWTLAK
jgi:branched-chain amino acid transport system substrate-binding protein